jgi:hypothetical protein
MDPGSSSYLRGLEEDFGESTNAIRLELNRFEAAGLLKSWEAKNKKMFSANRDHPLYDDIRSILRKYTGIDTLIDKVINNLGSLDSAYVSSLIPNGTGTAPIRLTLIGDQVDENYLNSLLEKCTHLLHRPVIAGILQNNEESSFLTHHPDALLIWKKTKT